MVMTKMSPDLFYMALHGKARQPKVSFSYAFVCKNVVHVNICQEGIQVKMTE